MSYGSPQVRAPEFPTNLTWFNTKTPPKLSDLRGKMVLLDFWTYCCINCMHVIPDLKKLEAKYPKDLVVIGVHSGKFDAEHDDENIKQAVNRYGITHPVLNDKDMAVWDAYTVRAWPTFVLIDPQGYIFGSTSGEGVFNELDSVLQKSISDYRAKNLINDADLALISNQSNPSNTASLSFPGKIAADIQNQRLIVSDSNHNQILVLGTDGQVIHRIGTNQSGFKNGGFSTAQFFKPQGVAISGNTIFVADTENHAIRKIDLNTQIVSTLAGTGLQAGLRAKGGMGLTTALNSPWDLVCFQNKLFIAMAGAHQIWQMDLKSNRIDIIAGSGAENIYDAEGTDAALAQPSGITTDGKTLYFADSEVSALRQVDIDGVHNVKTEIGTGLFDFGDQDGSASTAKLQHPLGVTFSNNKVYLADTYNNKVKVFDVKSKTLKTLVSNLNQPNGLTILNHVLYITNTNAHQIVAFDFTTQTSKVLNIF